MLAMQLYKRWRPRQNTSVKKTALIRLCQLYAHRWLIKKSNRIMLRIWKSTCLPEIRLVRDQVNKTFDIYQQRVKKYANSLPDSILPPPSTSAASGAAPRMGTPQNDTSWAGWAISSFTNKIATASGDMQAKPGASQTKSRPSDGRPSSAPPVTPSSRPPQSTSSASTLHRKALAGSAAPAPTRSSSDKAINNEQDDDDNDEIDEAWGDMAEDSFFDAPSEISTPAPPPVAFDDSGEPDFEGWLKAQAQAKSKSQLPRGLSKPSSITKVSQPASQTSQGRPVIAGSARSTPSLPTTTTNARAKQTSSTTISSKGSVVAPKPMITKPKDTGGEDDWGDAWD